jgi:hypothetical protein
LACPLKLFTGLKLLSHVEAFLACLMQCSNVIAALQLSRLA